MYFHKHVETCNFLIKYHINDGEQLCNVVKKISDRHVAVATAIKDKNCRLETLEKHLFMNEQRKQTKSVFEKYSLVAEYYELADEIKAAETVIRGLKMMEQDEPQRAQPKRTQELDL